MGHRDFTRCISDGYAITHQQPGYLRCGHHYQLSIARKAINLIKSFKTTVHVENCWWWCGNVSVLTFLFPKNARCMTYTFSINHNNRDIWKMYAFHVSSPVWQFRYQWGIQTFVSYLKLLYIIVSGYNNVSFSEFAKYTKRCVCPFYRFGRAQVIQTLLEEDRDPCFIQKW